MDKSYLTIGRVAGLLGVDRGEIIDLASRADSLYYRRVIVMGAKRRVLDIPRDVLKQFQRRLHDRVFSTLPVAGAVYSVPGKGVIENARQHLRNPYMAVLDIADCFPTITVGMVRGALERAGFDNLTVRYITRLTTLRGRLPQGPPSSPAIMNLTLNEVDRILSVAASEAGAVYTRYMDDLCFSGSADLSSLSRHVGRVLRHNGFATNPAKTRVWGPRDRHTVTKIVVSTELNPSPEYLRALAGELEREMNGRPSLTPSELQGRIAWVAALNPALGQRLRRRCHQPGECLTDMSRRRRSA